MLEILKILRWASQNNCLHIVHTVFTPLSHDYTGTSPEGPLKVLTAGTYRGPWRDSEETNINDLLRKLYFRSYIVFVFPALYGKSNVQMF